MIFLIYLLLISAAAIIFLVLFFVSSIISSAHGVPLVPTKRKNIKSLLAWSDLSANDVFYDLGCGNGRILISAMRDFGIRKAVGYEIAPWPYLEAKFSFWSAGLGEKARIFHKNFFQADLSGASFVYAYLFPKPIDRLAYKLAGELKSGSKILCPSFPIDLAKHPEFKLLKSEKIGKITAYLYEKI